MLPVVWALAGNSGGWWVAVGVLFKSKSRRSLSLGWAVLLPLFISGLEDV